jgi:hypothetical protein
MSSLRKLAAALGVDRASGLVRAAGLHWPPPPSTRGNYLSFVRYRADVGYDR